MRLPFPLLVWKFWPRRHRPSDYYSQEEGATLLHPALGRLASTFLSARSLTHTGSLQKTILLALLWIALILALMRPEWLEPYSEVRTEGYDLMLAVDTSRSMDALDFTVNGRQVTRMAVIKGVLGRFIEAREGDRIGIVVFGSQAFVLSPLSVDRLAVRQLLDGIETSIAGQGTALGDAIALGVKKLRERPPGSRVMILIADGDNTHGSFAPLESAALARAAGVRIYVIGVGSTKKEIPIWHQGKIEYWDDLTMDENTLQRIAKISGGAYFRATDTRALEEISARINQLEKTQAESRTAFLPTPLYRIPLAVALLALLGLGLFPEGRKRFVTRIASV